jgi:hypothetical protein
MKKLISILFILLICIITSCHKPNYRLSVHELLNTKVVFPSNMINLNDSFNKPSVLNNNHKPLMLCWFDSSACTSCFINSLYLWNDIVESSLSDTSKFDFIFIFSMPLYKIEDFRVHYNERGNKGISFIDVNQEFSELNPILNKHRSIIKTYLLDKSNTIKLVGNPIRNDTLWNMYNKIIDELSVKDSIF